ncbi:MAG: hypothetical protein HYV60_13595 [Planctomycetia bacterium]|nr:hypothetical protein [Planctomycetia bacterium]
MSKIGLLVECGREGLEVVMCRRIVELLNEEHDSNLQLDAAPMDNKKHLIEECGTVTADLLSQGCERVLILWDERPAWSTLGDPLCWHNDREQIRAELKKAHVSAAKAHLVCIEREFESWLLFDKAMLSCALSRPTHSVTAKPPRNPDRIDDPKSAMMSLFKQHGGGRYVDVQAARRFAQCLTSLNRLRHCKTFQRLEAKLRGSR